MDPPSAGGLRDIVYKEYSALRGGGCENVCAGWKGGLRAGARDTRGIVTAVAAQRRAQGCCGQGGVAR